MADVVPPPVFTARMVRELKGAPLSCLILLLLAGSPVSNEWLCRMSGYTDKPVAQALKLLSSPEYQMICRTHGGWRIADAFQLALMSRNISVPTTTAFNLINDSENQENLVVVAGRNFSDSLKVDNPHYEENMKTCQHLGIGEPQASKISNTFSRMGEPVTPDFIQAHVDSLQRGETKGLAILRILNDEFPRTWQEEIDELPKRSELEAQEEDEPIKISVAVETENVE
jgi:hypothetical protein